MYQLSIIIPIFNEEENLIRLEEELKSFISTSSISSQFFLINDGSDDHSKKLINEICKRNRNFIAVHLKKNLGLSSALKVGFDLAQTEWVGYIDSDLQTSPFDFELLWKERDQFDMVTGIRINRKDGFIKNLSSVAANKIRRLFTRDGVVDTGCPLKIIRTEFAQRIPMFKGMHRFLPALILLQNGKIHQVPVRHFERTRGKSKFGLFNRVFVAFFDCFFYLWIKRKYIFYHDKLESSSD